MMFMFAVAVLVGSALARAEDLPPLPARPVQGDVEANECPETNLVDGRPVPALPAGCRGIVLPVTVWVHLEDLAVDSREVRERWALDVAQLHGQLELEAWRRGWVEAELERVRAPVPIWRRPGTQVVMGVGLGAGAVLGAAWAIGEVAR